MEGIVNSDLKFIDEIVRNSDAQEWDPGCDIVSMEGIVVENHGSRDKKVFISNHKEVRCVYSIKDSLTSMKFKKLLERTGFESFIDFFEHFNARRFEGKILHYDAFKYLE